MEFEKSVLYSIKGLTAENLNILRRTIRKTYTSMPDTDKDYKFLNSFLIQLDSITKNS